MNQVTHPNVPSGPSRRALLAGGAGLLYAFAIPLTSRKAQAAGQTAVSAYVRIGTDESVTILLGVSEMGQGVSSGIAQVLAEELAVDWTRVSVQTADVAGTTYGNPLLRGAQGTFGSLSMRGYFAPMRLAGATVREMLKAAAALQLNMPVSSLTAVNGRVVVTGTTNGLSYGALAAAAAQQTPPANPPLLGSGQYIGVSVPRADIPAKTTGRAVFGIDVQLPGMLYASVQNCPVAGGTLAPASVPATPAGAVAVVPLDTAVAVIAKDTYAAMRLARSLQVSWIIPQGNAISSATVMSQAAQLMSTGPVQTAETSGWAQGAVTGAKTVYDQTFSLPYLAHACMEVLNCTALVTASSCTIWAPTQAQSSVVATAARITGLPASAVTVHTTFLGGGLGRKIEQDFIGQAIQIAKTMPGTPIKLTWSREQDFQTDQYRPAALVRVQAGLDAGNMLQGWWTRLVAPSYIFQHGGSTAVDFLAIAGATGLPYAFPNRLVEYVRHPATLAVGSWRSIGCSINTFATEVALDEIAVLAGSDPLAFRQTLLAGNSRALAVLNAAATLGNWGKPLAPGHAQGLAFCASDNAYVAQVIEISQPTAGTIKVHTVACAVDVGFAVNPDAVTAQIEGGIVHGLSAALWGQVTFSNGRANVRNFDTYRMMRMRDMPVISVTLINGNPASLGGAGEISVPPVAPALSNAWAALTGRRIRTLPFATAIASTTTGTTGTTGGTTTTGGATTTDRTTTGGTAGGGSTGTTVSSGRESDDD